MVNAAGHRSSVRGADALDELCQIYWPPLYSYLRGRGHAPEDAQDLTQGFFARVLERQDIRSADPSRGRFRSFLLTALKRYVINEHERDVSVKRGGRHARIALDFEGAERSYALDRREHETPERVFDRKWAAIVLDRALERVRKECERTGNGIVANALLPYLTDAGGLPPYQEVARELGLSEGAVKIAVHRLRQRFGIVLRLEIAETVLDTASIDDEVRELLRAVSA
jgi:RNA polymerase sigma-70 factor (ECF subfamily)